MSLLLATICGCSNDPGPIQPIIYDPGEEDLGGMDMPPDLDVVVEGPRCEKLDGEACRLTNATGICINNSCQLLACELGFDDCDGVATNGCEEAISTEDSCGACTRACRESERCQLGTRGYICSSGIVCSSTRFDLDQDPANACEWEVQQGIRTSLQPVFFLATIDRVAVDGQKQAALGKDADDAPTLLTSHDPEGESYLFPVEDAQSEQLPEAFDMAIKPSPTDTPSEDTLELLVGWQDELTYHLRAREEAPPIDQQLAHACLPDDGFSPQTFTSFGWFQRSSIQAMVSTESNLIPLERCSDGEGLCLDSEHSFGPADYVRMHFPYEDRSGLAAPSVISPPMWSFAEEEVAQCSPCVLDAATGSFIEDKRCWGDAQCRTESFDASAECVTCAEATSGCPDFSPVAILPLTPERFVVVTRRGMIVLDHDPVALRPVARLEERFEPGVSSGTRFVAGTTVAIDEQTTRVFLVHSSGYIRAIDVIDMDGAVSLTPAAPDLGFEVDLGGRGVRGLVAIDEETLVMTGELDALVIRVRERSARSESLSLDPDGSVDGFFGASRVEGGAELWRIRAGNLERVPVIEQTDEDAP
jgi:hypothetical protein